jgi:Phage integrase family
LARVLGVHCSFFDHPPQSRYVFNTERGGPVTRAWFLKLLNRLGVVAKLPFQNHPHMLRHACGFKLANDGVDTRALQHYLGHKNIQHTVRYTELAQRPVQQLLEGLTRGLVGGPLGWSHTFSGSRLHWVYWRLLFGVGLRASAYNGDPSEAGRVWRQSNETLRIQGRISAAAAVATALSFCCLAIAQAVTQLG